MSHFVIAVLTANGLESEVDALMAPYEESLTSPDSFWDWYEIGGRWDSTILAGNRCKVSEFPPLPDGRTNRFFGIITPDGKYHSEGRGGWWGIVHDEKPDWPAIEADLLSQHPDSIAVVVDFHV